MTLEFRPYTGIRVLDLTHDLGRYSTRLFADLGAEVIRIEPPGGLPDRVLDSAAKPGGPEAFAFHNASKRSLVLDLSGNRLPYSPERQASVFVKYDLGLGSLGVITPLLAVSYSSGFFGQPTNAGIEQQGAYTKADFKLNWKVTEALGVQAYVDNLTDKQTINRFVWGGGGALQVSAAMPRTFGLRLSYALF